MPAGRPSIYSEEYVTRVQDYINLCVDEIEEYHKTRGEKSDTYERILRVKLPTIEGLSVYLDINKDTINEWRKVHPEFSVVISKLLAKQAEQLVNNGLSGDYNPVIAKVLLTKHGYRDSQELTGADGKDLPAPLLVNLTDVPNHNGDKENT